MILLAAPPSPIGAHPMLVFLLQLTVLLGVRSRSANWRPG